MGNFIIDFKYVDLVDDSQPPALKYRGLHIIYPDVKLSTLGIEEQEPDGDIRINEFMAKNSSLKVYCNDGGENQDAEYDNYVLCENAGCTPGSSSPSRRDWPYEDIHQC